MSIAIGHVVRQQFFFSQTDLLAPTSQELVAAADGFLVGIDATTQIAVTTGGTIKANVNTVDVAGAVITVPNATAKGTRFTATATKGSLTRKVSKGDRIQLIAASFASAGALNGYISIASQVVGEENPV